jgi:hypothetical protein
MNAYLGFAQYAFLYIFAHALNNLRKSNFLVS